jgi:hypothetical protein
MNARSGLLLFSAIASLALGLLAVPARAQDTLELAGVTSDGKLWNTVRYPNGAWEPFRPVLQAGQAGFITDVDVVQVIGGFDTNGVLHLCAVNSDGRLAHTIFSNGGWQPFRDVASQAGERGRFVSVALANVINEGRRAELHLLGVTSDGRLWHAIRHANGAWEPFGDVKGQAGDPGAFTRVAASLLPDAQNGNPLTVLGITSDGRLFSTNRFADHWSPFARIFQGRFDTVLDVDAAYTTSPTRLYTFLLPSDARVWIGTSTFGLQPPIVADQLIPLASPGPVQRVSIGTTRDVSQLVHVAAITADGGLWHTLGSLTGGWQPFGDVKGQAGNPGTFVSVAVDGLR